jgi:hypothetical protein
VNRRPVDVDPEWAFEYLFQADRSGPIRMREHHVSTCSFKRIYRTIGS